MAVFSEDRAFTAVSWIAARARGAVDLVRNRAERLYCQTRDAESLRQSNEIILFGWSITLYPDGTALAENHLTGEMIELDAEQVADLKWAARPGPARTQHPPRA